MPDNRPEAPHYADCHSKRAAEPAPPRPRMRIVPLGPADARFIVVFDRVPVEKVVAYGAVADDMKRKVGAAGVIVVPDDIDVPQAVSSAEVR